MDINPAWIEPESDDSLRWSPKLPSVWSWIVSPSTSYLDLWVTSSRPQTTPNHPNPELPQLVIWDILGWLGYLGWIIKCFIYLLVNIPTISIHIMDSNHIKCWGRLWGIGCNINGWCAAPGTARKQKGGARSRWWRHLSWQVPELSRAQLGFFLGFCALKWQVPGPSLSWSIHHHYYYYLLLTTIILLPLYILNVIELDDPESETNKSKQFPVIWWTTLTHSVVVSLLWPHRLRIKRHDLQRVGWEPSHWKCMGSLAGS